MCGICGQYNFSPSIPVRRQVIERMAGKLVHRGPDDEGYYIRGPVGLGFRRLSIIDIEGGKQPLSNEDESIWVIFNGEIYNFPELRRKLRSLGHVFKTKSDTEVIVHGYEQWGDAVLEHLNGMFGLAIWDERKQKLTIARDRMGIKPLYYRLEGGHLTFASEIRSLLESGEKLNGIDPVSLNLFLRYRYTPSPLTVFKGICKLAPGTRLMIKEGKAILDRWWNFAPAPFDPMPTEKKARKDLLDLYQRAIKRQLISDVPVGILLSGGLDSGLLLALMNQHGNRWKSFTVGFGSGFRNDEISLGALSAKLFNSQNVSLQLDQETFEGSISEAIAVLEEPIAASSIVPMFHLCRRARNDVKVVLMGQGPDELFGGYLRHLGVRYGAYWRLLPEWMRFGISSVLGSVSQKEWIKRGLYSLNVPRRMERYQEVFSILDADRIDGLFHEGLLPEHSGNRILECWEDLKPLMERTDELGGLQFIEIRSSLPDELLMYADKLSMAHGLEVRVPYLDQEIVEYVECLPGAYKVRHGCRKWLHRGVCKEFLPREIVRRRKIGFQTPANDWFRGSLMGRLNSLLLDRCSLIYDFLRIDAVHSLVREHQMGQADNSKILFSLVVLEEWFRCFKPC